MVIQELVSEKVAFQDWNSIYGVSGKDYTDLPHYFKFFIVYV